MSFQEIISTIASIVSIVGGVLGIISAFSKEPVFTRLWQRQPPKEPQPALQPLPSVAKPIEKVVPPTYVQVQPRQILPSRRLEPGIVYGVISGVLASLILLGGVVQYVQAGHRDSLAFDILLYIGMGVLSILAGVLSSRATGYHQSAVIAGSILGGIVFLMTFILIFLTSPSPYGGWTINEIMSVLFACGAIGLLSFIVSALFGFLGCYLYKRVQVAR